MNPRKQDLIMLSQAAKALIESDSPELEGLEDHGINAVIKHVFYPAGEYNLFGEWKKKGLCVRKGEKGYAIWSRKRKMKKTDHETGDQSEFSAFTLAYIYHEYQVEKMTRKEAA